MVWYGNGMGDVDYPEKLPHAISIAVLMHYHRLLWSRLVGLSTRSLTEELQTLGLYRTIMWRLTALVHMFRLTMDVIQSRNGSWILFFLLVFVSISDPLFSRILVKSKLFFERLIYVELHRVSHPTVVFCRSPSCLL